MLFYTGCSAVLVVVKSQWKNSHLLINSLLKGTKNHLSGDYYNSSIPSLLNTQNNLLENILELSWSHWGGLPYRLQHLKMPQTKGWYFMLRQAERRALWSPFLVWNLNLQTRNPAPHKCFGDYIILFSHIVPWPGKQQWLKPLVPCKNL